MDDDHTHHPATEPADRLVPIVAGVAGFGLVIVWAVLTATSGGAGGPGSPLGVTSATPSYASAPAEQVQRVHDALHDVAAKCPRGVPPRAQAERQLQQDVDVVLAFADRYPNAQFPIDDETGTSLSLLIATRADLRGCAPTQAARVDKALPGEFRDRK